MNVVFEKSDEPTYWHIEKYGPLAEYYHARCYIGGKKPPWSMAISNIRQRCENHKASKYEYYGGKGIRCRITATQLMLLFYCCDAHKMKQPSVDRINSSGDYAPENVRWIEMKKNRMLGARARQKRLRLAKREKLFVN